MGTTALLLDKVLKARSIASDNALSIALGVNRQSVSKWRTGEAYPDEERIAQLAAMAGDDAGDWLLLVREERAVGKAKDGYGSLVRRLGIAALLGLLAAPAMASGGIASTSQNPAPTAYYVRLLERILDMLSRMVYRRPNGVRHAALLAL